MKDALIIFARHPEAGKVKTRLAATMGDDAALSIYSQLLEHTVSITNSLPVNKFVFYADKIVQDDLWHSNHYCKQVQEGSDLGERMKHAFDIVFNKGYDKIVIIGTDCPGLTTPAIMHAFYCLNTYDVVIGPSEDGGYYLLGMKQQTPALFEHIRWSTSTVLADTIKTCVALALKYTLLPVLQDIDEEDDLRKFKLLEQ